MNGYERLRESLRGTALDGTAERVKAAYDLRDDDPAWTYVATVEVASAKLVTRLDDAQVAIAEALADLPKAMRSAAVEIVRGFAAETASETAAHVSRSVTAAREQERLENRQRVDVLVREAQATQLACRRTIRAIEGVTTEAATKTIGHASQIAAQVRGLTERARIAGYAVIAALMIGCIGAATAGALLEYRADHSVSYAHGWQDGAAAARASQHR